jgi:hypothetical protein
MWGEELGVQFIQKHTADSCSCCKTCGVKNWVCNLYKNTQQTAPLAAKHVGWMFRLRIRTKTTADSCSCCKKTGVDDQIDGKNKIRSKQLLLQKSGVNS